MTDIEKAIQEFEDNAFHNSLKPTISEESKANALKALQEKAEREKGCEYCEDEKSMPTGNKNTGFYLAGEALTYTAQAAADDDFEDNTFVNYCPMCGRKL